MATQTKDYYAELGVSRNATDDQIKAAYRKLARKHHPDLNPGDKAAEERFKQLQSAYDVLSNPENRKLYDQYGDNWRVVQQTGQAPPPNWEEFSPNEQQARGFDFSGFDFSGFRPGTRGEGFDVFEQLFGGAGRARQTGPRRGGDVEAELELSLEEAHVGGRRTLQLQSAEICPTCHGTGMVNEDQVCPTCGGRGQILKPKTIDVNIPAGMRDGSSVRLAGKGNAGSSGGPAGDLYLHIRLRPHPTFRVQGDDVEIELPLSPWEAVLGAKIEVPTLDGKVEMNVPAASQSGQRLRLRGQGLNKRKGGRGDEYVRLNIRVPKTVSADERRLFEELKRMSTFNPRAGSKAKGA